MPENGLTANSDDPQAGALIQEAVLPLLAGPNVEAIKLRSKRADQGLAEAKVFNCDYVLSESLTQQSTGRSGRFMNLRAMQMAGSAAVFLPGASSVKQAGMATAQISQELATVSSGVKGNSDVTLHYTLTALDGHVALDDSAKAHSKSNGENVLTPLLTESSTKILAAAKPLSAPATADVASNTPATAAAPGTATLRTYQNYDFVAGDKPIFVDDFTTTQEGEFPEKWELVAGQGAVNQQGGSPAFVLNSGGPAVVKIRMSQVKYLGTQFTLEFDIFGVESQWGPTLYLSSARPDQSPRVLFRGYKAVYSSPGMDDLEGLFPQELAYQNFLGKWHHVAIAYKQPQLKVYVDQYRILYVPDAKSVPQIVALGGEAAPDRPVAIRDVRLASGGGANYVGKQFTDAKIVTHSINFDLDKASMRPESMGEINQVAKLMSSNPSLKFEIDGHTDNSGDSSHNLELSQQRADAVKQQLVSLGVDSSRLTTKGLGDTKPLGANDSPEGRANNRRVEFIRVPTGA